MQPSSVKMIHKLSVITLKKTHSKNYS